MSNSKYDKRVYAGYYKRYDGKLFYVVTMAKDGVTGEDVVIYMPYSIRKTDYLTISKKQFCEPVMVDGKLRARYKRQTQMRIEQDFIEVLENKENLGFVGTVNKGMKYSENDVI